MNPTGRLDPDTGDLVLQRDFGATIDAVWESIVDSDRLSRWFGTWTGDPTTGTVMVTMNAEPEDQPAVPYEIEVCDPPRQLAIRATDDFGTWHLRVDLRTDGTRTTLELRQLHIDHSSVADVGPGWEWYLDRLVAAVVGDEPPSLDAFEATYAPMSVAYAGMVGSTD